MIRHGVTNTYTDDPGFKVVDVTAPPGYRVVSSYWINTEDGDGSDATFNSSFVLKGVGGIYDTVRFRYNVNISSHPVEVTCFLLCEKVYDTDDENGAYVAA